MNGTTARLAIILVMFGAAVVVTWKAFSPAAEPGSAEPAPEQVEAASPPPPSDYQRDPAKPIRSGTAELPPVPEERLMLPSMISLSERLNDPEASVEEDLEVVAELIRQYQRRLEMVPSGGLNEEIVAALRGKNGRKLSYIADDHAKLNQKGELLDRFGTPYFFHPVSAKKLEVHSAGPDQKLWTDDDVSLREEE